MKISTKGRYSLRILLDLAQHKDEGYIPLKAIAERQGISKNYLDQLMMILNKSDFLKTTRGAQGGYKLAKEPSEYTLGDIIRVTEGNIAPLSCLENGGEECERSDSCVSRQAWKGLGDVMEQYLDGVTLQDLLDEGPDGPTSDFMI